MSKTITFTVLGRPQPQGSVKAFVVAGKARITSDNKAMRPWRQEISWGALRAHDSAEFWNTEAVKVTVVFVFARPASAKKSRIFPVVKPDIDKLLRAVLDACTGILWRDDAQVAEIVGQKIYGLPERAEIKVATI